MKLGTSLAQHFASAYERMEGAGWLCARLDGFDLHGRVAFGAADKKRLKSSCATARGRLSRTTG